MPIITDRIPRYPGRVTMTPVGGNTYTLARADDPSVVGTPINKVLFNQVTAEIAAGSPMSFENIVVATGAWATSATYAGWAKRASVPCTGALATMVPSVSFAPADIATQNFASFAISYDGGVYIFARVTPASITIPNIVFLNGSGDALNVAQIGLVNDAGATQLALVNAAGADQVALVEAVLPGEVFAGIAKNAIDIKQIENTLVQVNPTGDAKINVVTYETVNSLPKNAAQAGLSVIQGGMTAQNLVTNGNFSNGGTEWHTQTATISVTNEEMTLLASAGGNPARAYSHVPTVKPLTKYYLRALVKANNSLVYLGLGDFSVANFAAKSHSGSGQYELLSGIVTTGASIATGGMQVYIADARASGWENVYIKEVFTIDLIALFGAGNEPVVTTCDKIFADWFDATKGAVTGRAKSVGKNKWNPANTWIYAQYYLATGSFGYAADSWYSPNYIPIVAAGTYTTGIAGVKVAGWAEMVFYDSNKQYISGYHQYGNSTFTAPANASYARVSLVQTTITLVILDIFQLELGSVATSYEPFKSTEQYCLPLPLYRVPNGIRDTIENGKHIQRVQKYTLVAGGIVQLSIIGGVMQQILITRPSNFSASVGSMMFGSYPYKLYTATVADIGTVDYANGAIPTLISLAVAPSTYANLAAAQAALAGTVIYYQLATPIITDNVTSGVLLGYPSGSVYYEPVIADIGVYDTNLAIFNTAYPIASLESLYKIDMTTGEQLKLDPSTAVIASGRLSFTHASLVATDLVGFTYFFAHAFPYGENTYTYFDNNIVVIDTVTGKTYKYRPVVTNGAIASWALTEVV